MNFVSIFVLFLFLQKLSTKAVCSSLDLANKFSLNFLYGFSANLVAGRLKHNLGFTLVTP
ncbi:MAG: hypothetical protein ABR503_05580, partial [Chitinophagaceae bacterium]